MGGDERTVDDKLAPHDFVADFVWAAREVFRKPSVALVSIALWCVPAVLALVAPVKKSPVALLLTFGLAVFGLGWLGAERTFFRYRRDGKDVAIRDLLDAVLPFISRFLSLGVLAGIVVLSINGVALAVSSRFLKAGDAPLAAAVTRGVAVATMVALDLALTFVTPALVFTTRSAYEALRIGFRMIRQTWPRSGLYLLCPPLALNMLNAMYPTHLPVVTLVMTAGLTVLALVAKGATAAFYLRERPLSTVVVADVE